MPDISMCLNKKCPMSSTCYRFNCIPNEPWQSYHPYKFTIDEDTGEVECGDYIHMGLINLREDKLVISPKITQRNE